ETMTAILKEPAQPLPAGVPPALARIVWRCLEKTTEARFQSARDLAFALESLSSLSGENAAEAPAAPRRRRRAVAVGAILVGVIGVAIGWLARSTAATSLELGDATFTLLTNWEGTEEGAE